jgi:Tfp pilus assembly protein PilE
MLLVLVLVLVVLVLVVPRSYSSLTTQKNKTVGHSCLIDYCS